MEVSLQRCICSTFPVTDPIGCFSKQILMVVDFSWKVALAYATDMLPHSFFLQLRLMFMLSTGSYSHISKLLLINKMFKSRDKKRQAK